MLKFTFLLNKTDENSAAETMTLVVLFRLWESLDLELVPELCSLLIGDITHHEEAIRSAAAEALSSAVSQYRDQSATVLGQLTELYHQKLYVRLSAAPVFR